MANFARQYSTASPVLAIPPQPYYQTQLSAGTFGRYHPLPMSLNTAPSALIPPVRSAGRKRSRDEASINLEPDSQDVVTRGSQEYRVYGEQMISIKPDKGFVADASNQSGTWLEEKNAPEHQARCRNEASQHKIRSHKSQRLDYDLCQASLQRTTISPTSSNSCHQRPVGDDTLRIDNFTVHLGIGWRKLSSEEHIQAAARGWARFIENNFALSKVSICLESKGLQSYLVEASDGYYLFTENLRQGRLVSRTAEGALQNLQLSPPSFEGPELDLMAGGDRQSNVPDSAMVMD
ncbi:hypothetical protein X797_005382 [Metarhizium robertsii]|uniref:Uncharacterized protein n=2 Tax=Metarhizium robertsii TaxID=568076 RepID=E9ERU2_METRA|nr:uncharacterized protein MAA_02688 [Metarhizium robertsii ARSEF 23]EFZ01459.1 hypothetical protein MAA_02688 [Metarhizium robertsii ARSEF 23]EXV01286.1 hypothetical protein X797_005382 [Metarhizium robertsii]